MSGAIDIDNCPYIRPPTSISFASCKRYCGTCEVCGKAKHSAVHGPAHGQPVGSKPWGHEFVPKVRLTPQEQVNG